MRRLTDCLGLTLISEAGTSRGLISSHGRSFEQLP